MSQNVSNKGQTKASAMTQIKTQDVQTKKHDERLKPTADQIRLQQLLLSTENMDPEINRKIKQVVDVVGSDDNEQILYALNEHDYDVEKTIDFLLDGGLDEIAQEWKTVKNRKKPATNENSNVESTQVQQQQQQQQQPQQHRQPKGQHKKQKQQKKVDVESTVETNTSNNGVLVEAVVGVDESVNENRNTNGNNKKVFNKSDNKQQRQQNNTNNNNNREYRVFSNRRRDFNKRPNNQQQQQDGVVAVNGNDENIVELVGQEDQQLQQQQKQNDHHRNNRNSRGGGSLRRNGGQQQHQRGGKSHNDNMRNIGTWSNEQIKARSSDLFNREQQNEEWDNKDEEWQGDLSKTQIYTSTSVQQQKVLSQEQDSQATKINLEALLQPSFNTDFPIGHFDAKEATQQIKNAIGITGQKKDIQTSQSSVVVNDTQGQQNKVKNIPSVKPPPPSTKIPKLAVIMPNTSSNTFNLDVQFGVDLNDHQGSLRQQRDNEPDLLQQQQQQVRKNDLNDKNNNLNKSADQNNNKPNEQQKVPVKPVFANTDNTSGLLQQPEQSIENTLKQAAAVLPTKITQPTPPQPQQQQQQPQQHMMFNQQTQPQSAYVLPQQKQQQQPPKILLSNTNDFQQQQHVMRDSLSSVTSAMKDVNLNTHPSLITSKQPNLLQQQQQQPQTNTTTTTQKTATTLPPPPPGVNHLNPNNPFLMSIPFVYYDQNNYPYFDNSQLDGGNIMHMYSHQLSQLASVPTPIPATVSNTTTNFTTSDAKFSRVDPTSTNSQLNSNNAQQQTFNVIPNFPFFLPNYYPNMIGIPAAVPNGPQGNSQYPNKPFGFNSAPGYEDQAKDYTTYNTQAPKANELNFGAKALDKQQTNTGYHTPPPQQQQSAYANQLLNPNLNLNSNNLPTQYAYIASMIGHNSHMPQQQQQQQQQQNGVNNMQDGRQTLQQKTSTNKYPNSSWS